MKQLSTLLFLLLTFSFAFAQTNKVIVDNGRWKQNSTWSLGRVPADGDQVVVPKDFSVVVDDNINLSASKIQVDVYGALELKVGKLDLGAQSKVVVYEGGEIITLQNTSADKILIGNITKYTGAEGRLSGYLVASKSTSIAPLGFMVAEPKILPVKFVGFSVAAKNKEVLVQWSTAEEINAAYYEVERSQNGSSWTAVSRIKAVGNSSQVNTYAYTDRNTSTEVRYYRIKQVDLNGTTTYTAVKSLITNTAGDVAIVAAQGQVAVQFPQTVKGKVELQLISLSGLVVAKQVMNEPIGQVILNTTAQLKGLYVVCVSNGQELATSKQVLL